MKSRNVTWCSVVPRPAQGCLHCFQKAAAPWELIHDRWHSPNMGSVKLFFFFFFNFSWPQLHIQLQVSPSLVILAFRQWHGHLRRRVLEKPYSPAQGLRHAPPHSRQRAEQPPAGSTAGSPQGTWPLWGVEFWGCFSNEASWEGSTAGLWLCPRPQHLLKAPEQRGAASPSWCRVWAAGSSAGEGACRLGWGDWTLLLLGCSTSASTSVTAAMSYKASLVCKWPLKWYYANKTHLLAGHKVILAAGRRVNGWCISAILWILCNAACYHRKLSGSTVTNHSFKSGSIVIASKNTLLSNGVAVDYTLTAGLSNCCLQVVHECSYLQDTFGNMAKRGLTRLVVQLQESADPHSCSWVCLGHRRDNPQPWAGELLPLAAALR